jgi:putative addiction module antidote
MLLQKMRKVGNSFVVTIPKEEVERLNLRDGDLVGIEVRRVTVRPEMAPDVRAAFDEVFDPAGADYLYLKDR